jgi:hypothetical protein
MFVPSLGTERIDIGPNSKAAFPQNLIRHHDFAVVV